MENGLTSFEKVFGPLYGRACWQVMPSNHTSFLTLQFGEPHLKTREPIPLSKSKSLRRRQVYPRREWQVWIQECEWFVFSGSKLAGSWIDRETRASAAKDLDGQKLTFSSLDPATGTSQFEFDLGSRLETVPYDQEGIQWSVFEPSGLVLSYRFDGKIQYIKSDTSPDDSDWHEPT